MIQIISENAEDILMRFHQHLVVRKDLSDVSIGIHIAVVRDFASWYESWTGRSFHIWAVSISTVQMYQRALNARGMKPAAVRRQIAVLKKLIDWSSANAMPATRVS